MSTTINAEEDLTCADIAELLNLRVEYVRDRLVKTIGFPRPCFERSQKIRRWSPVDIAKWREAERRKMLR
jgi:hypothetical protein